MPQHFIKFYTAQMSNTIRELIKKAQPYHHSHLGVFISLMLPETWYTVWNTQRAVRWARAHFNGCLARAATLAGQYIISHPELSPKDQLAIIKTGTTKPSRMGNLIFMVDVQSTTHKVDPHFKLPAVNQVLARVAIEANMQSTLLVSCHITIHR